MSQTPQEIIERLFKNVIFLLIPSLVFTFLVLELFFRFVIHAAELPYSYFDSKFQLLRYDTNQKRDGVYTVGKYAHWPARWHINNMGWNSPIDYQVNGRTKPLIAIVGDSFVEGFNVNIGKTFSDLLRERESLKDHYDIYSFGMSGANLSQYYHMSRYVNQVFSPQVLIINFIYNDFDQLFTKDCRIGMLCLEETNAGTQEAPIHPYVPSFLKRIARHSSFMRYLILNLGPDVIKWQRSKPAIKRNPSSDHGYAHSKTDQIAKAADYLFKKFRDENRDRKLIFILDGPRREIYSNTVDKSWTFWMNQLVKEGCRKYSIEFIDMTGPFTEHYMKEHQPFDFPEDYHWNELGHQIVAETILNYLNRTEKPSGVIVEAASNK